MLRVVVISAGCALAVTTGALAFTGDSRETTTPANQQYGGVVTPPPPVPPPAPPPAVVPPPPPVAVQDIAQLPSNKKCLSRRNFGIRLRSPIRGDGLAEGRVFVNGKQVKVVRADRLRSKVNLVGLPKGRYVVKIMVKLKSGKRFTGTRRYYTCNKKLPGGIPKI